MSNLKYCKRYAAAVEELREVMSFSQMREFHNIRKHKKERKFKYFFIIPFEL